MRRLRLEESPPTVDSGADYLRECYRGRNAYADGAPAALLRSLHVRSSLDAQILSAVKGGNDVVLTGNPGDGKTHLLRVLEDDIKKVAAKATVELDASQITNDAIVKKWKASARRNVPYCIAINEGVLKDLADANPSFAPVTAAQAQVEGAVIHLTSRDTAPPAPHSGVVAFDLSRRNVLAPSLVSQVFDTLTSDAVLHMPTAHDGELSDVSLHREILRTPLFRQRLQLVFDQVSQRGFHGTVRDLQGFVSYLLFRGEDWRELARGSGNIEHFLTELVFSGSGPLFDRLRSSFDPGRISHPFWDERLIAADLDAETWLPEWARELHAIAREDVVSIRRRRRRFYFLNQAGDALAAIAEDPGKEFSDLLRMDEREALRTLFPMLNAAFHRAHASDGLPIWESHHFDHSIDRVLCSATKLDRREFEIAKPYLRSPMREAFELAEDHLVLRRKETPSARLLIDFDLYQLLWQAMRGVPVLALGNHLTRRLWQFMEHLSPAPGTLLRDEVDILVKDLRDGTEITITVDRERRQYLAIRGA